MSTATGQLAEQAAADFLKSQGYRILSRNWRTRFCEIDIVAEKGSNISFVEVKYRQSNNWGGGLDYITPQKLRQMRFAAENWIAQNRHTGGYALSAIELSGQPPKVLEFLPSIE